ncbi:MAG: CMD domain protein, partial [Caldilinea sp.]
MNHFAPAPGTSDSATRSARNSVDLLDTLAGIQSGTALDQLRRRRQEIAQYTQGSYTVLLQPEEVGGLSLLERGMAALRGAALAGSGPLVHHYREFLVEQQASSQLVEALLSGDTEAETPRARAILRHVDLLTAAHGAAAPADLAALAEQGLHTPEIVTLAQLIAFVSFQARVLAGLLLLDGRPAAPGRSYHSPSVENVRLPSDFTLEELAWVAWLDTVDPATATPRQLEVLEASHSRAHTSPYYLLLVHNAELLYQRSLLFNAVMYGREGLPRAERELATVAVSRINGCPYCASVHARLFVQLTKQPDVIHRLYE